MSEAAVLEELFAVIGDHNDDGLALPVREVDRIDHVLQILIGVVQLGVVQILQLTHIGGGCSADEFELGHQSLARDLACIGWVDERLSEPGSGEIVVVWIEEVQEQQVPGPRRISQESQGLLHDPG